MKSTIERLYWHSKIRRWKGKEVKEKEFKSCFFQWRIPKNIRHLIMKGMEKDGLIRIEKKMVYLNDVYLKENNNKEDKDKSVYVPYSNLFPQEVNRKVFKNTISLNKTWKKKNYQIL